MNNWFKIKIYFKLKFNYVCTMATKKKILKWLAVETMQQGAGLSKEAQMKIYRTKKKQFKQDRKQGKK